MRVTAARTRFCPGEPHGRRSAQHAPRRGFTIVELLVVIATVAILIELTLHILAPARWEASKAKALSTSRQLFVGTMMYAADYGSALPYFGTPGDPYAPVSYFGWAQPYPQDYFRSNEWHWASLIVPDYLDTHDDSIVLDSSPDAWLIDASDPPPPRLFRCSFLMTDTAFAAPGYWRSKEPPEDLSLIRGTRITEIEYPSLKGLMIEFGKIGLIGPKTTGGVSLNAEADASKGARVLAVTGDGAAAFRPFITSPTVEQAAVERPFGCWSTYIFATRNGLRGRDW